MIDKLLAERGLMAMPMGSTGGQMAGWFRKEVRNAANFAGIKGRIGGFAGKVRSCIASCQKRSSPPCRIPIRPRFDRRRRSSTTASGRKIIKLRLHQHFGMPRRLVMHRINSRVTCVSTASGLYRLYYQSRLIGEAVTVDNDAFHVSHLFTPSGRVVASLSGKRFGCWCCEFRIHRPIAIRAGRIERSTSRWRLRRAITRSRPKRKRRRELLIRLCFASRDRRIQAWICVG